MTRIVAALVLTLAVLVSASAAFAHASLLRSTPAEDAILPAQPSQVVLTFNEPVSPLLLRLVRPDGSIVDLTHAAKTADDSVTVDIPANAAQGTRLLSWRVISADGHPVGGAFVFSVGSITAHPDLVRDRDGWTAAAIWLARTVLYLGIAVGVGGAFFSFWLDARKPGARLPRVSRAALGIGLVAALLSVGLQGADALGSGLAALATAAVWRQGFDTSYGTTLCIVAASLLAAGMAGRSQAMPGRLWTLAALSGVGLGLAWSGHASTSPPGWLTRPAVFLHAVTMTVWVGSILPLSRGIAAGEFAGLTRFSKFILVPLTFLFLSGILLATIQVRQVDALWTTAYGRVLLAKLALVALILAVAAFNRMVTPRVASGDRAASRRMRGSLTVELILMIALLGVVSLWRFTPPPRALLAVEPASVRLHAEGVVADVTIRGQGREIRAVLHKENLDALPAREVAFMLSKPDAGLEPIQRQAVPLPDGGWKADGSGLPLAGRWHLRMVVLIDDFNEIAAEDDVEIR